MADTTTLTLYGDSFYLSPYVFSCHVTLREKRLPFAFERLALWKAEQRLAPYRERAFTAKVPALAHGDFWLTESSAIIEYLEDVFPAPEHPAVLPASPITRARCRQVMSWIRSDLMALREERPTSTMFYERATAPLSEAGRAAADTLLRVAEALIPASGGPLFGTWSIADADLAFMLHRLILNDHDVPPAIRRWAGEQWQRPSVQEFVAHEREAFVPY